MSVQRPVPAPDPYNRPATVTYGAQNVPQSGFLPAAPQQHATQQWMHQAQQQPAASSYNPGSYPPMPGAAGQPMTQGYQQQNAAYGQQMPVQASAPVQYQPIQRPQQQIHPQQQQQQPQQPQMQHRWSVAGQIPVQGGILSYQQQSASQPQYIGIPGAVEQAGNYVQPQNQAPPPPPPPKDATYTQQAYQQPQQQVQYQQPHVNAPAQNYQYGARPSSMQSQHAQYAVAGSQPAASYSHPSMQAHASAPAQSPQQSFPGSQIPQGQQYTQQTQQTQGYTPYQPPTQTRPASQPWSQGSPQVSQQSQQNHATPQPQQQQTYQAYQQHLHGSSATSTATPAKQDEPVSPITGSRQNTAHQQVSRPNSNHMPSRSNSNSVSQSGYPKRPDSSPISALKTSSSAFIPKRKVMDPNGIGSTGSTALGMGGPSDWENFGPTDFEVDDLDYYSGKQEPQGVTKVKEGKTDGEPIELPAASPTDEHGGAVEIDSGSPAGTRPVSYTHTTHTAQPATSHQASDQYSANQSNIMLANTSQLNAQSAPSQPNIVASPPLHAQTTEPSSDINSGWRPSPQMPQTSVMSTQQHVQPSQIQPQGPILPNANSSTPARPGSQGSWAASNQPPSSATMSVQVPPAAQHGAFVSSLSPRSSGVGDDAIGALQRKLQQTESELAHFKDREMESRLDGDKNSEQLQGLQNRIFRLEDECRVAQSECSRLENNIESMENASVAAAKEKASVEMQHNNLLAEKVTWSAERSNLAAKIGEAEIALSKAKAEKSIWDTEKASLSTKLAESQTLQNNISAERATWDTERAGLLSRITNSEALLSQSKAEADSTREGLAAKLTAAELALTAFKNDAEATSTGYQAKLKEAEQGALQAKADIDVLKKQIEDLKSQPVDIAPGLGDWYKGSLARFAETLFSEEAAVSVPDKMRKFQDWVNSEAQLRGIEMQFQHKKDVVSAAASSSMSKGNDVKTPLPLNIQTDATNRSIEEDDIQYSPGGRPMMQRKITDNKSISDLSVGSRGTTPPVPVSQSDHKGFQAYRADSMVSKAQEVKSDSTSKMGNSKVDAVSVTKPLAHHKPKFVKPAEQAAAPGLDPTSSVPPLASNVNAKPLAADEIFLDGANKGARAKSPSTLAESALPTGLKPKTPTPFTQSPSADATSKSQASAAKVTGVARSSSNLSPLDQLQDMLPRMAMPTMPLTHPHISPVNAALSRFADTDFSFIANIASQWEAKAADTRKRLDSERARRQTEAEERTSQLFQDGAIGYGDIGQIEGDNKDKELEIQEQETNAEWQSYLKDIFGATFELLQKDIKELMSVRDDVDALCQTGVAGQQALEAAARPDASDRAVALDDALQLLIRVHSLLVTREAEADKLVVERDRRYKKNITRSLYRKGQIKKMKEQEIHFERLERKANVERRRERLKNCGLLMKDVKASVGRGCDDNEAFAAEIIAVIRKVALDDALVSSRKQEVQTAIRRANDVLAELAQGSTALMRHYERVDVLLNEAEYEHQVAVERASDAAESVFHELEAQKKEQDRLLKVEAGLRESAVDKTLQEWRAELTKITAVLGMDDLSQGAAGGGGPAGQGAEDKKKRLQAALEEAKRRNGDL